MYRVSANTRQEYILETKRLGQNLEKLDAFICEHAPHLKPWFYNVQPNEPGMTFKMLSYGAFTYRPKKDTDDVVQWPVIGVAVQKNYVSMYVSVTKDGKPIVDFYKVHLNSTRSGNNNFSFKAFDQLDKDVLKRLLQEVEAIFKEDPANPIHFKEG